MKRTKPLLITALLLSLLTLTCKAQKVAVVDGLSYMLEYDRDGNNIATLICKGKEKKDTYFSEYKGEIVVPEYINVKKEKYKVTTIGRGAFANTEAITSVTLPEGLRTIGSSAFNNCGGITQIDIPASVVIIGKMAFSDCKALETVHFDDKCKSLRLGTGIFLGCTSLRSVHFPTTLGDKLTIPPLAFAQCTNLSQVDMGDNAHIGEKAFLDCTSLVNINRIKSNTDKGYREALFAYLEASDKKTWETMMSTLLVTTMAQVKDIDATKAEDLIKQYAENRLQEIMIDSFIIPLYKPHVTEAELRQLTQMLQSKEGQDFLLHNNQALEKTQKEGGQTKLLDALEKIEENGLDKVLKEMNKSPQAYTDLYAQYYKLSGIGQILENVFMGVINIVMNMGGEKIGESDKKEMAKFTDYISKIVCSMMTDQSYGILSEDDLRFGIQYYSTDAYRHTLECQGENLMGKALQYIGTIQADYKDWLKEQGYTIKDEIDATASIKEETGGRKGTELTKEDVTQYLLSGKLKEYFPIIMEAANAGNKYAQWGLAMMYGNGLYVAKDAQKAFGWYLTAAEQGEENSQAELGLSYMLGIGVDKDYTKAMGWLTKAAEQNNSQGLMGLSLMYHGGYGVAQDDKKALDLATKAAEIGNPNAFHLLSVLYTSGSGIKRDTQKAAYWRKRYEESSIAK